MINVNHILEKVNRISKDSNLKMKNFFMVSRFAGDNQRPLYNIHIMHPYGYEHIVQFCPR